MRVPSALPVPGGPGTVGLLGAHQCAVRDVVTALRAVCVDARHVLGMRSGWDSSTAASSNSPHRCHRRGSRPYALVLRERQSVAPEDISVAEDTGADLAGADKRIPSTSAPASPTTSHAGRPHFVVGTVVRDFTDPRRQRTLHAIVHFPVQGEPDHAGSEPAGGAFPLVLMAHGYLLPAAGCERILDRITAAGYIVAAPSFPHTSPQATGIAATSSTSPADLIFVLDGRYLSLTEDACWSRMLHLVWHLWDSLGAELEEPSGLRPALRPLRARSRRGTSVDTGADVGSGWAHDYMNEMQHSPDHFNCASARLTCFGGGLPERPR